MKERSPANVSAPVLLPIVVVLCLLVLAFMPFVSAAMIDLGTLGTHSHALAINEKGQVVGFFETRFPNGEAGPFHAFLWENGTLIDIGSLGGGSTVAYAINNRGQVVGRSGTRAFLWEDGIMRDLGTLGGSFSLAQAINDKGEIAGLSENARGQEDAFLWKDGAFTDLGNLGQGWLTYVVGINKKGLVAGTSVATSGEIHAFLWDKVMIDLGTLGCFFAPACPPGTVSSRAQDLNNRGQVVGQSFMGSDGTGKGVFHGFIWENGSMKDLGDLGGNYANARAINDRGQVTGESITASGLLHAFLWENGTMSDLGIRAGAPPGGGSSGYDINNQGQIAGWSESHAVFWDRGVIMDLGTLGGANSVAITLNERGQVIGDSLISTGDTHGFLWELH